MRASRSRRSVTTWPVAFSLRSSRSLTPASAVLLAQRMLDPLHGVGLLAERQSQLLAHGLGLADAAAVRHQDQHQAEQRKGRQETIVRRSHWLPYKPPSRQATDGR